MLTKLRFLLHMIRLAQDPERTDQVFRLADVIRSGASAADRARVSELLLQDPEFKAMYESGRPELVATPYDIARLAALPPRTLGYAYAQQMRRLGLDPEFFEYLPTDDPLGYLQVRMRKTHDIWHVVAGYPTSVPGEIGLQAFYFGQLRTPLPIAIMTANFLHLLTSRDMVLADEVFSNIVSGYQRGKAAAQLKGVIWEDLWDLDLTEVRARLRIAA
jgi:ubiquinone biosynthesis protein Coq4